jgi:hypothetical protein
VTHADNAHRKNERGVTIVLVAFSLLALLGMAALAIDIATLYLAHGEAQRAADAAALAGARMFAASGYTSASSSLTPSDICQTSAGPGAAAANRQAAAVAVQNLIAGQPATVQSITCSGTPPANPQITVAVQRTGLPSFFGRIWGFTTHSVSATAVAEAYNPSGSTAPIQVQSVKPWLIPNCDPTNAVAGDCVAAADRFVDNTNGSIQNNGSFVGKKLTLIPAPIPSPPPPNVNTPPPPPPPSLNYYTLNVPIRPPNPVCPSTSAVSCGLVGSDNYHDNVACTSTFQFSCGQTIGAGQTVTINPAAPVNTNDGTQCLIHASGQGLTRGQDAFTDGSIPVTITGGDNNPNPALQGVPNISRSDSIVTVPIYHKVGSADLCPGACTQTATIVGFLQLGITQNSAGGNVEAVIMNVAGCAGTSGTAISGGGVSPIPVRLIHQ